MRVGMAGATTLRRMVQLTCKGNLDFQPLRLVEIFSKTSRDVSFLEFGWQKGSLWCFNYFVVIFFEPRDLDPFEVIKLFFFGKHPKKNSI